MLHIQAHSLQTSDYCPDCQQPSSQIHSRYTRHAQDLPCTQQGVHLELVVHRFRCANPVCRRRTFVERLSQLVPWYARRTQRLTTQLRAVAFEAGAEAGARIGRHFGIRTSGDTLLRILRQTPEHDYSPPRVVGIDDWAFKKGLRYGTILIDLERHCPIDLLPDRQIETVQQWLAMHPCIELVARDRSQDYARAIAQGAPQAVQIADRWHLLKNLTDALEKVLYGYIRRLKQWTVDAQTTAIIEADDVPQNISSRHERQQSQVGRPARLERYRLVHKLHDQGWQRQAIAQHLGICTRTVSRYLAAATFPEHRRHRTSKLDRYKRYLLQRWNDGCHNATRLADEIRSQGYRGGMTQIREYVARLRQAQMAQKEQLSSSLPSHLAGKSLTPRRTAFLLLRPHAENDSQQIAFHQQFFALFPELQSVVGLFQAFAMMVRERQAADFDSWLQLASHSDSNPLKQFVRGLQRDEAAVRAALEYEWSSGQSEGQINRLKLIKRQMYGRARFDLLRIRVLHPT